MSYHLGVDLGTTYTAAAVARDERAQAATLDTRSVAVPSVVYLGGNELVVGQAAARRSVSEPSRVAREFKRRVGDPTPILLGGSPVAAELLMARLLGWVVHQVATSEGAPPASLAVTHPANWGEYKLDLLRQAVRHVGLTVDHLIPEPVAAASFYASERDLDPGSVVAVYDLGGGTFDAAVVRVEAGSFRIIGRPDGIERLGGIDFDHAVFNHVAEVIELDVDALDLDDPSTAAAVAQLRESCVDAKEALSSDTDVSIPVMLPGRHTAVRLTRSEFEAMIRPALDETLVALRRAVTSADIPVEDLHAVLLVGGSSRIPLVAQLVTAQLGRPAAVDARPKEAISLGAALAASKVASQAAPVMAGPAPAPASEPATASLPPAPPDSPPRAVPAPTPGRGLPPPPSRPPAAPRPSRAWLVAAAAGIIAVAAIAALVLRGRDDGREPDTASDTTTQDGGGESSDTTNPDNITTTSDDDGSSGEEPILPLPGDDWNDEARAQFVEVFAAEPNVQTAAGLAGKDPEEIARCVYDTVEGSGGITFDQLNEAWVAEDVDPTHPAVAAMSSAVVTCGLPGE